MPRTSLDRSGYYALYYDLYKHRYIQRYKELKDKKKDNTDYKKIFIDMGFLIVNKLG